MFIYNKKSILAVTLDNQDHATVIHRTTLNR